MIDWSKLPDLFAVALLICAFASIAKSSRTVTSTVWLIGWITILVHFGGLMFLAAPGVWGRFAAFVGTVALVWCGELFRWAAVPFKRELSSRWMLGCLVGVSTVYIGALTLVAAQPWILNALALLLGIVPLAVAMISVRRFRHRLRWITVLLYGVLSVYLMGVQNLPGIGADLAFNGILFAVFFGCCVNFFVMYRSITPGALVTIAGFFAWANVFTVAPAMAAFLPGTHIESEVWNLPKYVVAVGMILLLLEEQIEHNKFLALHDELTGLPNRRLFQDRLSSALERARRTGAQAALLLIDLDRFKNVNDTYGHHVGDLLLVEIGRLLSGRVRRSDTVARTGGDEFCVILEEPTNDADAEQVGCSLSKLLAEPIDLGGHRVKIGASIGIAVFPEDAPDAESLSILADLRMYTAKGCSGSAKQSGHLATSLLEVDVE